MRLAKCNRNFPNIEWRTDGDCAHQPLIRVALRMRVRPPNPEGQGEYRTKHASLSLSHCCSRLQRCFQLLRCGVCAFDEESVWERACPNGERLLRCRLMMRGKATLVVLRTADDAPARLRQWRDVFVSSCSVRGQPKPEALRLSPDSVTKKKLDR